MKSLLLLSGLSVAFVLGACSTSSDIDGSSLEAPGTPSLTAPSAGGAVDTAKKVATDTATNAAQRAATNAVTNKVGSGAAGIGNSATSLGGRAASAASGLQ